MRSSASPSASGLLSKFTYVVFLAALGLAALSVDRYRARVLRPEILVTALVATLLVLPYALWFATQGHDLGRIYAREVRIEARNAWAKQARAGLGYITRFLVSYVAPVALAVGLCFPAAYRRLQRARAARRAVGSSAGSSCGCSSSSRARRSPEA
jgi:4-amino-4-deoxy-L-arabinose transferase-like glycosyltransferase